MDIEGQGKLRRRDRVRKINETAKFGPDDENNSEDNKGGTGTAVAQSASTHYPFIIFIIILMGLLYLITSRKGGTRKAIV
jgi:hypothetical protein